MQVAPREVFSPDFFQQFVRDPRCGAFEMLDISMLIFGQAAVDVRHAEVHEVRSQTAYGVLRDVRGQNGAGGTETEHADLRTFRVIVMQQWKLTKFTLDIQSVKI